MLVLYHIGVACKQGLVCLKIAGCPQQMAGWSQAVEWEEKQSHLAHSGPLPSHPPPAPQVSQHALSGAGFFLDDFGTIGGCLASS